MQKEESKTQVEALQPCQIPGGSYLGRLACSALNYMTAFLKEVVNVGSAFNGIG